MTSLSHCQLQTCWCFWIPVVLSQATSWILQKLIKLAGAQVAVHSRNWNSYLVTYLRVNINFKRTNLYAIILSLLSKTIVNDNRSFKSPSWGRNMNILTRLFFLSQTPSEIKKQFNKRDKLGSQYIWQGRKRFSTLIPAKNKGWFALSCLRYYYTLTQFRNLFYYKTMEGKWRACFWVF